MAANRCRQSAEGTRRCATFTAGCAVWKELYLTRRISWLLTRLPVTTPFPFLSFLEGEKINKNKNSGLQVTRRLGADPSRERTRVGIINQPYLVLHCSRPCSECLLRLVSEQGSEAATWHSAGCVVSWRPTVARQDHGPHESLSTTQRGSTGQSPHSWTTHRDPDWQATSATCLDDAHEVLPCRLSRARGEKGGGGEDRLRPVMAQFRFSIYPWHTSQCY
ncbi:hypothetical protein F4809DRAFT_372634 [Biscogniauxia mediterranea]|nr:hypothetical protein F4809DRAFT_372634 [Biscogniauxia mediterranea]